MLMLLLTDSAELIEFLGGSTPSFEDLVCELEDRIDRGELTLAQATKILNATC